MAGTETKRIIELTEASTVQSGDYFPIDSASRGTKKVPTDALATSAALTAETNARAGADEAEQTAREEADDALTESVTALSNEVTAQSALIQNPTKTLSGALCSFTDGADMPMVACTAEIVPKQSGTGTPSPDNVRPISGWESVNLYKSGKNKLEVTSSSGTSQGITATVNSDGSITMNGTATGTYIYTVNNTLALDGNYTLSGCPTGGSAGTYRMDCYWSGQGALIDSGSGVSISPNGNAITSRIVVMQGVTVNNLVFRPMIRLASDTDPTYEPYTGTTTTTDLGRTVYGGTLDVVSGVLTVDRAMVDLGSLDWYRYSTSSSTYPYRWMTYDATLNIGGSTSTINCICSRYAGANWSQVVTGSAQNIIASEERGNISFVDPTIDDMTPAQAKSAMSGVQLCYELKTPQTIQLTPTEVKTLLGENNVWADSGDVEITYRRDISIVINNLESALNG